MVCLRNLKKSYGNILVFDGLTLSFYSGEISVLVGPSGCGKTTLLRIIAGLEKPDEGEVIVPFEKIGFLFQEDRLFPWLSAYENVMLVTDGKENLVRDLFKKLKLDRFMSRMPAELSGGMRRRVALIRTLSYDPDLFLFDEPTKSLDEESSQLVWSVIIEKVKGEGKTAIVVSHSEMEALEIGDRVFYFSSRPMTLLRKVSVKYK